MQSQFEEEEAEVNRHGDRHEQVMAGNSTNVGKNKLMNDLRHESLKTLLATAEGVVADACAVSTVFNKDDESRFPKFKDREVVAGKVIGRGGFCVVRNVDRIRISGSSESTSSRSLEDESGVSYTGSCLPWLCASNAVAKNMMDPPSTRGGARGNVPVQDERFSREYVAAASRKKSGKSTRTMYMC